MAGHDHKQIDESHLQLVQGHLLFLSHQGDHEHPERKIKITHLYLFTEQKCIDFCFLLLSLYIRCVAVRQFRSKYSHTITLGYLASWSVSDDKNWPKSWLNHTYQITIFNRIRKYLQVVLGYHFHQGHQVLPMKKKVCRLELLKGCVRQIAQHHLERYSSAESYCPCLLYHLNHSVQ